jgi:hypothetical protein
MVSPWALAASAAVLAAAACGTSTGRPSPTTLATAEQRQRYGLPAGTRVLLELDSSRNGAGRDVASFQAPRTFSLTAVCDGEGDVTVAFSSVRGGRERGGSYSFQCRRPAVLAPPLQGRRGAKVDVDVFDNEASTWSVLFFVPAGG